MRWQYHFAQSWVISLRQLRLFRSTKTVNGMRVMMKSKNSSLSQPSLSRGGAGRARLRASYDKSLAERTLPRQSLSGDESAPRTRREPSIETRNRRPAADAPAKARSAAGSSAKARSAAGSSAKSQNHGYRPASVDGVRHQIQEISTRATDERLECAIPLLESLRMALALDRATHQTPPGTLTVKGWSSLLGNWEGHIQKSRARQMMYTKAFFDEIAEDGDYKGSPLEPIFQQLVLVIQSTLEQKGMVAA
ncbi:hypothetical protein [Magnetococcus sp. PR-3]|uniref:hypothetical protein n=1 Tax=Magnetococcus sp. PR-3 TaxID=3120355 RepID=UPI002FCDF5A5